MLEFIRVFPVLRASSSKARKPTSVLIAEDDHAAIVEQEDQHFKDDGAFDDVEAFGWGPLNSKPSTLNPEPLNPKPLNPKPLNPKPLNPKPLNPKP